MLGVPFRESRASLEGLHMLVDMQELAPAAQGGFRLLIRVVDDESGAALPGVYIALSDVFLVTPHPMVPDPSTVLHSGSEKLEKLPYVTKEMSEMLSDIPGLVTKLQAVYPRFEGFGTTQKSIVTVWSTPVSQLNLNLADISEIVMTYIRNNCNIISHCFAS